MKRAKKLLILALTLSLVTGIFAGCGNSAQTEEKEAAAAGTEITTVRLQLKWLPQTQWMGYYVAQEKGFYEEEGIDIEILPITPSIY